MSVRFQLTIVVGLFAAIASGCGSNPPGESHITGYTREQELNEFAELYRCSQSTQLGNRAPTRLQELEKCKPGYPFGYLAATKGDIVVMWGTLLGEGKAVLAYEREAPTKGGWVLLQNGKVTKLTLSEFRAAPKAEK